MVKNLSSFCSSIYWTQNSKYSDAVHAESLILIYGKENINEELNIAGKKFNFSEVCHFIEQKKDIKK